MRVSDEIFYVEQNTRQTVLLYKRNAQMLIPLSSNYIIFI